MRLDSLLAVAGMIAALFAQQGVNHGAPSARFDPDAIPALDLAPGRGAASNIDAGYRPDPAVRRKLADIMGDAAAKQGPEAEADMRQVVLSGRAVAEYEKVAPMLGYHANDAVDGLAFYLLAQWGVANDHRPAMTRAQAAGVRRQAANAFASVADQVNSDALRQEFGEMLMIQGAIMAGTHEAALRSGDEAALARYAEMARRGGRQLFQADPVDVLLTDDGFRHR
ncbi:hypothetical protein C100_10610 [Sphingobium sp. C100]|uniref:DUF6683 family protein n=1 Tax=Sphingobium sp. C100 TaxID=1207055 RepID=UPI0003D5E784|nr:DUF6683 family protein [Sphingobium sp. C100]ETI63861.1 hypothetical protein C100_10610 [Sphingobium sp. C100]